MLRITVKYQQQQFNVESQGSRKIQEFMEMLINQLKLPPGTIYGIFMQDAKLDNNKSFIENRVQSGQVLELKPVKQTNFGFVKVMYNNTPNFMHTDLDEQCDKLYNEVAAKISKQNNTFTLEFNGRMLEKQRPLKDYGVVSSSIINVIAQNYSGQQANPNAQTTVVIYYSNQNLTLPVPGQTLVSQIENTIKNKFNLNQDVCLTTVNGLQLQPGQTIGSYNLPVNTQLTVNIKQQQQNQYNQPNAPIQQQKKIISDEEAAMQESIVNKQPVQYLNEGIPSQSQPQKQGRKIILLIEHYGQVHNVEVDDTTIVSELETTFQDCLSLTGKISFIFNGKPLNSNTSLQEQNVIKGSRLEIQTTNIIAPPQQFIPFAQPQPPFQQQQIPFQNPQPPQTLQQPSELALKIEINGQVLELALESTTLVQELEQMLKESQGITQPAGIYFQGQQLQSNMSFLQQRVPNGSKLEFKLLQIQQQSQPPQAPQAPPQSISLRISYEGAIAAIEIDLTTQIQELQDTLQEQLNLPQKCSLSFANQVIPPQMTIQQLNLKPNDILYLTQLTQQPSNDIELIVSVLGEDLVVAVSAHSLVYELINTIKIEKQIYMPTELLCEGRVLVPSQSFIQQKVLSGAYLIMRNPLAPTARIISNK